MAPDESMLELVRQALIITLKLAAPLLAAGVIIGLLVSIVQSVTSIQDQTISFVPKTVAMVIVALILIPWIVQRLVEYTQELFRFV
jgi:flagellar biosynthetic protein FliQ